METLQDQIAAKQVMAHRRDMQEQTAAIVGKLEDLKVPIDRTVIAHGVIIPDIPKVEVQEVKMDETNQLLRENAALLRQLIEEIKKPCKATLKLK